MIIWLVLQADGPFHFTYTLNEDGTAFESPKINGQTMMKQKQLRAAGLKLVEVSWHDFDVDGNNDPKANRHDLARIIDAHGVPYRGSRDSASRVE